MNIYSHLYPQIFLDNKYTNWYLSIINNAISRKNSVGLAFEKHHIIPECMFVVRKRKGPAGHISGNSYEKTNLVKLTCREHFICHLLLRKMMSMPDYIPQMNLGLAMMCKKSNRHARNFNIKSWEYELIRKECAAASRKFNSGKPKSDSQKKAMSLARKGTLLGEKNPMFGRKHSPETIEKMRQKKLNKKHTEETKSKMSKDRMGENNNNFKHGNYSKK
jgi:hypothetical protein